MKFPQICLALLAVAAVSCKQHREIKVYRVSKEGPSGGAHAGTPEMMPGGAMPNGAGGDPHAGLSAEQLAAGGMGGAPAISDAPPANWKKQAANAMRQASYLVEGDNGASADISFSILRGAAGGDLENVNRWRGQLGLPPIDEAAFKANAQTIKTPVGEAIAVELEGLAPGADAAKDGRMVGVIAHNNGDGWFYKMRGNSALVAAETEAFLKWVASVKPAAPAAHPAPDAAAANGNALTWVVPDGWTLAPKASSMRYATFTMSGADGSTAELAVSHFPGDVGGDLENVNRWRGQVGLPPVAAGDLPSVVSQVEAGPEQIALIDVTGATSRMIAGWTRHGPDTWFFKLIGPDALVGAEKDKFTAFLKSVRFNTPE